MNPEYAMIFCSHPARHRRQRCPAAVLAVLLAAVFTSNCLADSLRCGRKVVRSGDAQSQVLSACGKPQFKDSSQEAIWIGNGQKNVSVKRWYYKRSSRSLERVVWFYKGKVIAVKTGGR